MNNRLSFSYRVIMFPVEFNAVSGKMDSCIVPCHIHSEHQDRLEEIVRECLLCFRKIYIVPCQPVAHPQFVVIIEMPAFNGIVNLPRFRDDLFRQELILNEADEEPDFNIIEWKYEKQANSSYEWRCNQ